MYKVWVSIFGMYCTFPCLLHVCYCCISLFVSRNGFIKIVLVGDPGVGKTSLLVRYTVSAITICLNHIYIDLQRTYSGTPKWGHVWYLK